MKNPSFEQSLNDWAPSGFVGRVTNVGVTEGGSAARLMARAGMTSRVSQTVDVVSGATYSFAADVAAFKGIGFIVLGTDTAGALATARVTDSGSVRMPTRTASLLVQIPSGVTKMTIDYSLRGKDATFTGMATIDNVRVVRTQ